MKINESLKKSIENDHKNEKVTILQAKPGAGLVTWLQSVAKANNTECFAIQCRQLVDTIDLTGTPTFIPPHTTLTDAIEYAEHHPDETPMLVLDGLDRATHEVTVVCCVFLFLRAVRDTKIPDNLQLIGTSYSPLDLTDISKKTTPNLHIYRIGGNTKLYL